MCGIAGFISPARADAAALAPMLARIAHRGPDGQGTFVEGPAALGHCRLAIIDLQGGAQPLYSEDKNFVVVFNGEIYNYRELTAELTALGHTFTTHTDTEVLLHGWEQWGRELLPRLRGMFAFALWDRRAQVLFCARDMFGIKPLYYCRCADGTLLFASEIKAFLDHPSFEKQLNTAQLPLYLSCQYSPGRDTFFAGVQKLLPGHFLEFSEGIVRTTRWVQPAFLPGDTPPAPDELEAVLRQSAEAHKIADVEVAGFLSGGVDSAYLTALARPARTYTISYAEPKYDESFPARALARNLGLRNRVRCISPGEHTDFAEYLHWKAALFQQCRTGVFNIGDPWVGKIVDGVPCRAVTYGTVPGADVRADSNFTLTREGGRLGAAFTVDGVRYTVGMPGAFSVQNALAALAAARVLGAGEDAIRRGLAAAVVQGRVEPVAVDAPFTVLIDYAHNEAAAESLLRTLRAYTPARLVAVFGCGGERSRLRRFGMGSVCARLADFCVITEDNSRSEPVEHILADIRAGLKLGNPATPFAEIPDRRQAIYYALAHAQPGDIVAILGKGHETTIERNGVKEPFVESEIVEEIIRLAEKKGIL